MTRRNRTPRSRDRRNLSSPLLLALLLLVPWLPNRLRADVIDFENLTPPGNGTGGLAVRNQYATVGVVFSNATALDFAQGIPIPSFAHSGTKAVTLCYGFEFCTAPLEVTFTGAQRRVRMWFGYTSGIDSPQAVILRAFDAGGNQVAQATQNLSQTAGSSTGPIPISTSIEVMRSPAAIRRVTFGFVGAESATASIFNNGLAVDDVEFDSAGAPPPCPATLPPGLALVEPIQGQVVLKNLLTVRGTLTTPDPFANLRIVVTGPASQSNTFGPMFMASGPFMLANITGILFPGQNTVAINLQDCFGSSSQSRTVHYRPDVTNTPIRVIDENQMSVPGAQVYADGNLLGVTNTAGMLYAPPLQDGVRLIARKFVTESTTYRGNHSTGSYQDWKYRGYITSATVNNNGSVTTFPVKLEPDPLVPQTLRVLKRNTIIGLHVVASIEWDASLAEMETVRQKLVATSQFLFNATDGQILIEQADVVDDATWWEDADYRVYADQSLRAHVDSPRGGFFEDSFWTDGSWMHMQIGNDAATYAHEFGHYGFKVGDEYSDDDPSTRCTSLLNSVPPGANPFQSGMPRASCMMFSQWGAPKLCSGRAENRHVTGTRQGDDSCWSTVAGKYGNSKWTIRTPETRGSIMGPLNTSNFPMNAWAPRFSFTNKTRSNLCAPIEFLATRSDGTPWTGREIWLHTTYGADILEGKTNMSGLLTGTGIHVGDRVENLTIAAANCSVVNAALPRPATDEGATGFVPAAFQARPPTAEGKSTGPIRLVIDAPAFNLLTALVPAKKGKGAEVVVRAETLTDGKAVDLAGPPTVLVKVKGRRAPARVSLRRAPGAARYSGSIAELPIDQDIVIEVSATDRRGHSERTRGRFSISAVDPEEESDVNSPDGQLSLTVPAEALPGGARIAVGPSMSDRSAEPGGHTVVSGPYAVSSNAERLARPATVRFHLPNELDRPGTSGFDEKTFRILRQDPSTRRWEDLGGTLLPYPIDKVTARTSAFGVFVLVARPANEKPTPSGEKRPRAGIRGQLTPRASRTVNVGLEVCR